jgi:hypothetical protein
MKRQVYYEPVQIEQPKMFSIVGFKILTAVAMNVATFWDIASV